MKCSFLGENTILHANLKLIWLLVHLDVILIIINKELGGDNLEVQPLYRDIYIETYTEHQQIGLESHYLSVPILSWILLTFNMDPTIMGFIVENTKILQFHSL